MTNSPLKPRTVQNRITKLRRQQAEIEEEIKDLRKRCTHDWQYHPDPSGNNDSEWVCNACHESRRSRP